MTGDNADGSTNIVPIMDLETLKTGYRNVIGQLYSSKLYNSRIKTFYKEYNSPHGKTKAGFINTYKDILAFIRSIYILGILDKERLHYWKLFFWTLLTKPSMMSKSITFAIYGYHFRIVYEKNIH